MVESNDVQKEADLGLELCEKGKLEEGIKHLRYAAEHNNTHAIVNLGHALKLSGQYEESFKWTLIGANLGEKIAMSNLAIMYRRGQGTPCNVDEAVKWGKKLIELGNVDEGYNEIVCSYRYAEDSSQVDEEKAFKYALEGAQIIMGTNPEPSKRNECETVIQLAIMYDFGKGVETDKAEAKKYYEYCHKCGLGIATYNLACICAFDEETKDIKKALELFAEAIDQGYADAYYQLGYLYEMGESVDKDLDAAKYFYSMAIRNGNGECRYDDAVYRLKELSSEICERILSGKYCKIID